MIKNMEKNHLQTINSNTDKKELRRIIKEMKNNLELEEIVYKSNEIIKKLIESEEYKKSNKIYVYVNYNQEVITADLIEKALADKKEVLVPKVYGEVMKFHKIKAMSELAPGAYGILEPVNDDIDEQPYGLMLLPGLAFDKKGNRMGYGGGFYDKYLEANKNFIKVALAYDFQLLDITLPHEEHDIGFDVIITEQRSIRI